MAGEFERHVDQALKFVLDPNKTVFFDILQGGSIGCNPLIHDKNIYFTSCDGHVYALNSSGELLWNYKTGDVMYSSPTIYGEKIYVGSYDKYVYCLDLDGRLVWRFLSGGKIVSSPVIVDDRVYFGSENQYFYCIDAKNGELIWNFKTMASTRPAFVNLTIREERVGVIRYFQLPAPVDVLERAYKLVEEMRRGGYGLQGSNYNLADVYHFSESKYGRQRTQEVFGSELSDYLDKRKRFFNTRV